MLTRAGSFSWLWVVVAGVPGESTVEYKVSSLVGLQAGGVSIALGNGNRASDAQACGQVGVLADHIFLKRAEFAAEVDPVVKRGEAIGVDSSRRLNLFRTGRPATTSETTKANRAAPYRTGHHRRRFQSRFWIRLGAISPKRQKVV